MSAQPANNPTATRWAIRLIPLFIFGAFGFAIYVVVAHLCVNYLIRQRKQHGTAIALIVLFFIFFLLQLAPYLRTFISANHDPGLVPFNDRRRAVHDQRKALSKREREDLEAQHDWLPADLDPDSPGLEAFYTKDIFVCEPDGRPRWCTLCWHWKPDRAHHSSDLGRCVRKMDHLCPWVGGMVSETSFNFFFQFTFHCTLFLAVCVGAAGYCLAEQQREHRTLDGRIVAILALAGLFGVFTFGMTMTSGKYIFENITNIDMLRKTQQFILAVRVPLDSPSTPDYWTVTYPLPRPPGLTQGANGQPLEPRDDQARRTFAILRTEKGENPWDLGPWRNFKSVMGNNVLEWLLPIRHSPCCNHESPISDYEYGPVVDELKKRYKVPEFKEDAPRMNGTSTMDGIELGDRAHGDQ